MAGLCEGSNEPPGSLKASRELRLLLLLLALPPVVDTDDDEVDEDVEEARLLVESLAALQKRCWGLVQIGPGQTRPGIRISARADLYSIIISICCSQAKKELRQIASQSDRTFQLEGITDAVVDSLIINPADSDLERITPLSGSD
ncbi:hypothetical protein ANN_20503 [Periplaneta americana]|uniref:Uncharacterized protein n=1 Tax=Periplaneta americana TaxID=6978 RepID=A0ABQ8SD64_PERAM|nr:hypothetical protein ANN_20503 [Periplaneta americana]